MQTIKQEKFNKELSELFEYEFEAREEGLYIIEIGARARSEKQIGLNETDDDDLRIEIDSRNFPKLNNAQRYLDSGASFSGGKLHNLKKTIYFLIYFSKGNHILRFIPDRNPILEDLSIKFTSNRISDINLEINQQAEDGDRRSWITFVLVNLPLKSLRVEATTKWRLRDSDDLKLIIDNKIQENKLSIFHKNWLWSGSVFKKLFKSETQIKTIKTNFSSGLRYIEFWADKMPVLHRINFDFGELDLRQKAKVVWSYTVLREEPTLNSRIIVERINKNEKVIILEKAIKGEFPFNEENKLLLSDRWHKVKFENNIGYIFSMALEIECEDEETIKNLIIQKSKEFDEDKCLMLAIAKRESRFFPYMVSSANAQGVFQLMEDAVLHVNEEFRKKISDRFDINQNIEAGILYFQIIKRKYEGKDNFWEKCLAGWNRGMKKVKADEVFIIDDQPIETQQFIQDVFKFWEDCKNKFKNSGKILLYSLLLIGILALIFLTLFFIKKPYSIPSNYADYVVLREEKIDINKDGKDEKIVVISNIPTEFTFGDTKILLIRRDGSFLELPDDGGEFQWFKIDDFNKNRKTDIAVLYGYSGSAGFGQFYLYEWDDPNFITLFSREEINSKVDFKDLNNDGIEEILYSYSPLKWDKEQQDVYRWDKESLSYIKS